MLAEASRTLEQQGADAITLRGLARSLDVSHAAPGHHFASKTELLGELAADGYRELADEMADAIDPSNPGAWLVAVGRAYIRFAVANPERYRLMFASQLMASGDCPDRLISESTRAYLLLLTAAHKREPDLSKADEYEVQIEELAAWSVVHGLVMLWLDGQIAQGVGSVDRLVELGDGILSGLFA